MGDARRARPTSRVTTIAGRQRRLSAKERLGQVAALVLSALLSAILIGVLTGIAVRIWEWAL